MPQFVGGEDFTLATGRRSPLEPAHPAIGTGAAPSTGPMRVVISHEFFTDVVVVGWDNQSEELTHAEAIAWFKAHGAKDEEIINRAINCAINLGNAELWIKEPIRKEVRADPIEPKI